MLSQKRLLTLTHSFISPVLLDHHWCSALISPSSWPVGPGRGGGGGNGGCGILLREKERGGGGRVAGCLMELLPLSSLPADKVEEPSPSHVL